MTETILFPGKVEWSGENPGISLKEDPSGPFTTLASFFRVMLSPHGRGHALVLLQAPEAEGAGNVCLTDNEPLARWLVSDYVAHFGAWRGLAGLRNLEYRPLDSVTAGGDAITHCSETVLAADMQVALDWKGLGMPFCFAFAPAQSATDRRHRPTGRCTRPPRGFDREGAPRVRHLVGARL